MTLPLFPLNSIVLPGGHIPLQLFERRYLDMLSRCMREDQGFVIVLMREQQPDSSKDAAFYEVGTRVKVVDFSPLDNGLLGITVAGDAKVQIDRHWQQQDGLHMGEVSLLPEEPAVATPFQHEELANVLRALVQHPAVSDLAMDIDYADARHLGWRLTELLPLEAAMKQRLVELDDPVERLDQLAHWMESMS